MITRRNVLLGGAAVAALGVAGVDALRWRGGDANAAAETFEVTKTPAEWQKLLTPEQYAILREADTERAFTSPLNKEKREGVFACAGCDLPLFSSDDQVRQRHGLAELLSADRERGKQDTDDTFFMVARRGPLPPLRRPSRPCLRRRPEADRLALLHQRARSEIRPGLGGRAGLPLVEKSGFPDISGRVAFFLRRRGTPRCLAGFMSFSGGECRVPRSAVYGGEGVGSDPFTHFSSPTIAGRLFFYGRLLF